MRITKSSITGIFTTLALLAAFIIILMPREKPAAPAFDKTHLTINKQNGEKVDFSIEVADNDKERMQGLMFRKEMPENHGMLFIFDYEQSVSMWMKDTFIPLDMIFIGTDGKITKIIKNTTPESKKILPSGSSVIAVLEINAMISDKFSIREGDYIDINSFSY